MKFRVSIHGLDREIYTKYPEVKQLTFGLLFCFELP